MADIRMCVNAECPRFAECYRAQATPKKHWQSWYNGGVIIDDRGCDDFIEFIRNELQNSTNV